EIRNKPPTKAQQKSLMCTYMKNMEGLKQKDFKGKIFDDIKKIFDKVYKRVNTFVDMNTENVEESLKKTQAAVTEGSSKRAGQELEQERKAKMIEPEKPLKKKDQIELDEEVTRKLEAEMKAKIKEEERIAREKYKANRAVIEEWDDV
nr:hypothetical protein [Tanacetum cinerariifolium]